MFRHKKSQGFTIVEVMIFLSVSGLILASATGLFLGRQRQIQYEQGVRNLDFRVGETINSVVMGYFPRSASSCQDDDIGDSLEINTAETGDFTQGINDQCAFIGNAIEIDSDEEIIVTPLVAANPPLGETRTLVDSKITPATTLRSAYETSHGLILSEMIDQDGEIIEAVMFLSSFGSGQEASPSLLDSGVQSINLFKTTDQIVQGQAIDIQRVSGNEQVHICATNPNNSNIKAAITLGFSRSELSTSVNQDIPGDHPCQDID